MDPSKRLCLKNLPENCTKKEIADMIRNRCGVQPHSIDLGLDENGATRRYAHFSCEGVKHVLEALSGGSTLRGNVVQVLPAKVHYSWRLTQAREKREREEEEEQESRKVFCETFRQRLEAHGKNGEISPQPRKLRSFYYGKQKYGAVASELAAKLRARHQASCGTSRNFCRSTPTLGSPTLPAAERSLASPDAAPSLLSGKASNVNAGVKTSENAPLVPQKGNKRVRHQQPLKKGEKDAGKRGGTAEKSKTAASRQAVSDASKGSPNATVSSTPEPSKRERKLTGLQGKLALLKQKLKQA